MHTSGRIHFQSRQAFTFIEVMIASGILAIALSALASSIYSLQNGKQLIKENRQAVAIAQAVIERIQGETWDTLGKSPATWHRREAVTAGLQYVDEINDPLTTEEFMHRPLTDEPPGYNLHEYVSFGYDDDNDGVFTPSGLEMEDFARDAWGLPFVSNTQAGAFDAVDPNAAAPGAGSVLASVAAKYDTPQRYNWLQFLGIMEKPSGLRNLRVYVEYYRMQAMTGVANMGEWNAARDMVSNQIEQSHILMDLTDLDDLDAESVIVRVIVVWDRKNNTTGRHEVVAARRQ